MLQPSVQRTAIYFSEPTKAHTCNVDKLATQHLLLLALCARWHCPTRMIIGHNASSHVVFPAGHKPHAPLMTKCSDAPSHECVASLPPSPRHAQRPTMMSTSPPSGRLSGTRPATFRFCLYSLQKQQTRVYICGTFLSGNQVPASLVHTRSL